MAYLLKKRIEKIRLDNDMTFYLTQNPVTHVLDVIRQDVESFLKDLLEKEVLENKD